MGSHGSGLPTQIPSPPSREGRQTSLLPQDGAAGEHGAPQEPAPAGLQSLSQVAHVSPSAKSQTPFPHSGPSQPFTNVP